MKYKLSTWPGFPNALTNGHQPDLRPYARRKYKLQKGYTVTLVDSNRNFLDLTVPVGFKNDGASVPRVAWTASGLTPDGLLRAAALVHDFLYRRNGEIHVDAIRTTSPNTYNVAWIAVSRADADRIFLDLMLAAGLSKYRSRLAHLFVRLFGRRW